MPLPCQIRAITVAMDGIRARGPASLGALLADAELDPEAVAAFEGQLAGLPLEAMMRRLAEVCV